MITPIGLSADKFNLPTILVIFGATGDLARKKIIPALFHLYLAGRLPKIFQVVCYARRPLTDADFYRDHISPSLDQYYLGETPPLARRTFADFFSYLQGDFNNPADYTALAAKLGVFDQTHNICTNKLFYLSVPPTYYRSIFTNLKNSGLTDPCGETEGWTRVLVEKPFGDNEATARALDEMLSNLFKEEQIYRIDHYLAKEMLQNILTFRFANNLFGQTWNNQLIERIDLRLLERIGVEDRGAFYDAVGALRDVGQNHLLQMLALATMENPVSFTADAIRSSRTKALRSVAKLTDSQVLSQTFRAQYEGYRQIAGVKPDSSTETYFKLKTQLTDSAWTGVPITLEAGKRLGQAVKEVVITFRHPSPCLCPDDRHLYRDRIIFQLEPVESIKINFWAKKPGFLMELEERSLDFTLHQSEGPRVQYVAEYAKLLLDAIHGDQTFFLSTEEIHQMWQAIDPIVAVWQANGVPLHTYPPDSAQISQSADLIFNKEL